MNHHQINNLKHPFVLVDTFYSTTLTQTGASGVAATGDNDVKFQTGGTVHHWDPSDLGTQNPEDAGGFALDIIEVTPIGPED